MNGIVKVLTGILGVLAVMVCLATVGIVGYALIGGGNDKNDVETVQREEAESVEASAVPTQIPEATADPDTETAPQPLDKLRDVLSHVHDYE